MRPALVLFFLLAQTSAFAGIHIEGDHLFKQNVMHNLEEARKMSPHLKRLIEEAENAYMLVTIKPITDDPSTWHADGSRTRSHADPLDGKPKSRGRSHRTSCEIFMNPTRVDKFNRAYKYGTLVHELAHALDMLKGQYHPDYQYREKRAVVFQNIWRDQKGRRLRATYHDRFDTLEYQSMQGDAEAIEAWMEYYFTNSDLP